MLKGTTTPDAVADILRQDIIAGRIGPGDALRQQDLAARFGVSRIPIREALRHLESDGLVVVYPNRGAYVIALTIEEIVEITDMRVLLEGDLLQRAVPLMSADDLLEISRAAARLERVDGPDWIAADRAFHEALYAPAQRPRQLRAVLSLRRDMERHVGQHAGLPARRDKWAQEHQTIIDACSARDAEAAVGILVSHVADAGTAASEGFA